MPAGDVEYGSKKKGVATSSVIRDELAQVLCAQPGGVLVQSLATAERRGHGAGNLGERCPIGTADDSPRAD